MTIRTVAGVIFHQIKKASTISIKFGIEVDGSSWFRRSHSQESVTMLITDIIIQETLIQDELFQMIRFAHQFGYDAESPRKTGTAPKM